MGRERCPECGQAFVSQTSQEIIWLAGKGSSQAEGNFDSLRLPAFKSLPTSLGINQAGQYVDNVLLLASSEFQSCWPRIQQSSGEEGMTNDSSRRWAVAICKAQRIVSTCNPIIVCSLVGEDKRVLLWAEDIKGL